MKKIVILFSVLAIVAMAFAVEPEYAVWDSVGTPGQTLYISANDGPKTFNTKWAQETSSTDIIAWFDESMFTTDKEGMPTVPALATKWWFSEDGLTSYFQLRKGIVWSDGEPFTADDVLFTFNEVLFVDGMTANGAGGALDSNDQLPVVQKIDDWTVSFTWTIPNVWGFKYVGFSPIIPEHVLKESVDNGTFSEKWNLSEIDDIVAIGPFIPTEYTEGVRVVLQKNPNYWRVDKNGVKLPYLDKVVYTIAGDDNTQLLKFEAGEVDIYEPSAEQFPRLAENAQGKGWVTGVGGPELGSQFITFNFNNADPAKRSWFRNDHFRKAFVYAMDRDAIIETLYNGLGTPLYGPVSPSSGFYNPDIEKYGYKYSITRARLELKKAGFSWLPDGTCVDENGKAVAFEIQTNAGNKVREAIANIIVDGAKKLGIDVTFVGMQFNTLVQKLLGPDYDAVVIGLTGSVDPGSGWNTWRIDGGLHMFNYPPESRPDTVSTDIYELPTWEKRVDEIYKLQTSAVDSEERYNLFAEFQDIVANEQPLVYTIAANYLYAHKDSVHLGTNSVPSPAAPILWAPWAISKDAE